MLMSTAELETEPADKTVCYPADMPNPVAIELVADIPGPDVETVVEAPVDKPVKKRKSSDPLFTDAELAAYELRLITSMRELASSTSHMKSLEAQFKESKKEWKEASEAYDKLVNRGPEHMPLFDNQPNRSDEPAKCAEPLPVDQSWRDVPLTDIIKSKALVKRLEEHDIKTAGQLEDLRGKHPNGN